MRSYASLVVFVGLVAMAAGTGMMFEPGAWYEGLAKPSWTPPNWVFPVAWTILYVMIAIAGWLVWRASGWPWPIAIWGIALLLNAAWSYLMFDQHEIGLALADLTLLWLAIVAFIVASWNIAPRAAYLFIVYLAWVSFAGALNFEVWRLNG